MNNETTVQAKTLFLTLTSGVSVVLNYVGLGAEVFAAYALLLIIDYVTGIGRAYVLKIPITSKEMRVGMLSKLGSLFIPIVLALGFKAMGADGKSALTVGMSILCLSEAYSSISNIYAMKTGNDLPEIDAIASLARWLKGKILLFEEGTANEKAKREHSAEEWEQGFALHEGAKMKQDVNNDTTEQKVEQDV